jgi:predicted Zn-dependent protease
MTRTGRLAHVALAAALATACATSPTGRKQLMLVSEQQAISDSRQACVQEMGRYQKEGKLVTDPRALNRGRMAIYTGLIQKVDPTDDELAQVLATAAVASKLALVQSNSRTAESEADRIGMEMAAKAGYDPRAAVTLWQKMGAVGGGAA